MQVSDGHQMAVLSNGSTWRQEPHSDTALSIVFLPGSATRVFPLGKTGIPRREHSRSGVYCKIYKVINLLRGKVLIFDYNSEQ